jgi:hypothetical protein
MFMYCGIKLFVFSFKICPFLFLCILSPGTLLMGKRWFSTCVAEEDNG